jgi:ABC-type bacteriocin/lantibiotic exporter with double-glycine peptidase domain
MQILLGLILLAFYHPAFILFGFLLIAILALIFYVTGNKGFKTSLAKSSFKYAVAGWLEEMARVIRSFKFSSSSQLHMEKADEKVADYLRARKKHFNILLLQYKVLIAFKVIITAAMLIVGCLLLLQQQINIGQFVAAEIVIITVINSVEKLIVNLDSVYSVMTSVEKIGKLTDKPIEESGKYQLQATEGLRINCKDLKFGYNQSTIINSASFAIESNQRVCITGNDGSGKSTLLRLLTGVYRHFDGSILINGLPIGNYELSSLRTHTGLLLNQQDVFHGTLWENLSMGNDSIDEDYLLWLCQKVGLSSFIDPLKKGLDTELDPTGIRLPKNAIQKILLVRALMHKPKLLLLEEPWQGIEEAAKKQIQELLLQLPNTTVVVATNDLGFMDQCDQVIQLQSAKALI